MELYALDLYQSSSSGSITKLFRIYHGSFFKYSVTFAGSVAIISKYVSSLVWPESHSYSVSSVKHLPNFRVLFFPKHGANPFGKNRSIDLRLTITTDLILTITG